MPVRKPLLITLAAVAGTIGLGACRGQSTTTMAPEPTAAPATAAAAPTSAPAAAVPCAAMDKVTLQLKWDTQAQFAGYYAAKQKDYADACLDVTIVNGGPNILPEQVVASGQAEFGITWLPSLLNSREKGMKVQTIAQVFQRSGMLEISWKDAGILSPADLKGKKVAVWMGGNEYELFATLEKYGLDREKDLTIVSQPFNMQLLLDRQVDAVAAMGYNELAQVLETRNPATGQLYRLEDLNLIDFNKEGTAMLEDEIVANEDWLQDPAHQDIAVRFLRASFKGWVHCRDHPDDCVDAVMALGPTAGRGHQVWQLNEVNQLIWPSPEGIGIMAAAEWQTTAGIALERGVIKTAADPSAYTNSLAEKALEGMKDVDATGMGWTRAAVQPTEGGK